MKISSASDKKPWSQKMITRIEICCVLLIFNWIILLCSACWYYLFAIVNTPQRNAEINIVTNIPFHHVTDTFCCVAVHTTWKRNIYFLVVSWLFTRSKIFQIRSCITRFICRVHADFLFDKPLPTKLITLIWASWKVLTRTEIKFADIF